MPEFDTRSEESASLSSRELFCAKWEHTRRLSDRKYGRDLKEEEEMDKLKEKRESSITV